MILRRGISLLVGAALLLYLGYAALIYWHHTWFLYPFLPNQLQAPGFAVSRVTVPDARSLPVQVSKGAPGAPTILYFMGNVGALDLYGAMLRHHQSKGRSVVAMPYRGGGGVQGTPSEVILKSDALAVFDALPDLVGEGPVILQGHSLGTGLAMYVAAHRPVQGMLLTAPFYRMCEVMADVSHLPACSIPGIERWDSAALTDKVTAPILILHGELDKLIPINQGQQLARSMPNADFLTIEAAGHTDLFKSDPYIEMIDGFVDKIAQPDL